MAIEIMQPESIIAIIVAIIAATPGIYSIWRGRRMAEADTTTKLFDLVKGLTDELHDEQERRRDMGRRVIELESKIHDLQIELNFYRDGVNRLVGQLQSHGIAPVWTPEHKAGSDVIPKEGDK